MAQQTPNPPASPYRASDYLRGLEWPEEDLTSTADEGGGFYPLRLGEAFDERRFVVTRKLGWGGYSTVWLARDRGDKRHVALKVLSAHASREIEAGRLKERELLRKVTSSSPLHRGFGHVIHLLHEFMFESFAGKHICFVTDVLSYSVPALQDQKGDPRLPLRFVLHLVKHVLQGLEYLHDECKVVHSDLKPGNILLLPSDINKIVMHELSELPAILYEFPKTIPPEVLPFHPVDSAPIIYGLQIAQRTEFHWVIADLGHAHPQEEHLSGIVQPYALRAPEVILGLEWGPAIDIWSLGCMMFEFATGRWLFTPEATNDIPRDVVHLAQMAQRTGQDHDGVALRQYEMREKQYNLKGMLERVTLGGAESGSIESELSDLALYHNSEEELSTYVRIMRSFLALDPAKRPRAAEALLDPALKDVL